MGELMKTDRCTDCEFGKGFIELCECPVCHASKILGDVTTRQIHCPNGCAPLPFAVDFCAKKNCDIDVYDKGIHYRQYTIIISGSLNPAQISVISKYFKESAARVFLAVSEKREVSGSVNIFDAVRLSEYLEEHDVEYEVLPGLPLISRIWECWEEEIGNLYKNYFL